MAITADDLAVIRSHVGSTPDDADLTARWERLGTVETVALEVLRGRLADMLARPTSLRVDGDFTESYSANIKALQEKIRELEAAVASGGTPGAVHVAHLTRSGRSR